MTPASIWLILRSSNGNLTGAQVVGQYTTPQDAQAEALALKAKTPANEFTIAAATARVVPATVPFEIREL